jgi:hypothetical protein
MVLVVDEQSPGFVDVRHLFLRRSHGHGGYGRGAMDVVMDIFNRLCALRLID